MTVFNLKDDVPLKTAPKWDGQCVVQYCNGKTMVHRVLQPTYDEDFPKSIYVPVYVNSIDRECRGGDSFAGYGLQSYVWAKTKTIDYLFVYAGWHCGYGLPIYVMK